MALRIGVLACVAWLSAAAAAQAAVAADTRAAQTAKPPERRVFLLGLRQRGDSLRFASLVSNPTSPSYRQFLTARAFRARFSPPRSVVRRTRRYLASQPGVRRSS